MRHARLMVMLALSAMALATIPFAASQQPTGDPFSTEIRKVKDGLYVIPGYDGAVTGGNVAVRVTSEGAIIVDDRLPPSSAQIAGKVKSVTAQPIKYMLGAARPWRSHRRASEFIKVGRDHRAPQQPGEHGAAANWPRRHASSSAIRPRLSRRTEVQAIYLGRGHTNGDAVIYFRICGPSTPVISSCGESALTEARSRHSSIARAGGASSIGSRRSTAC